MQIVLLVVSLAALACDAPRDPEETLTRVRRGGVLNAGASEDPPFLVRRGDDAVGIEAALIKDFAARNGAHVHWVWGAQETQFRALEKYQLDLVAGAVSAKTLWKKRVAVTRPYLESTTILACRRGVVPPTDLRDVEVAIEDGDPIGAEIEKQHGNVKRMHPLDVNQNVVAGNRTRILGLGYVFVETLQREKRSLATAPGENAFLQALEVFLAQRHDAIANAAGEQP
ncbi:MAG: transporter substrate-binding domain-containing protein [Acidobacteria bacterium]|nr:transporter substrate-binding domain-containing protein [Acidobacteriota bacterium]MBV9478828.1 transporter substrate-binding domain-containing protein [Acidobacteriota bacterium]